ncbi:hypothetical protein ES708_18768 [subsurface metagenome]
MIGEITEEQLQKVREPIPFTPTKRLERDDVLYVTEDDIPHPVYGYAKAHKEYSVIDLRGYRKGYEPRLEISGIYTPNPEDIFRLQTGKLPPYQPTTTGDRLLAEMRRLGVHKAFRIVKPEVAPEEVAAVGEVKEPWQMTRAEFVEANPQYPNPEIIHRSAVFGAVNRGEVIAPEVLNDYPDLAERYKEVPKPPAVKTEEWKLREAIADTVYGLAHGVKEEDIRKHLTRNPGLKYWLEPEDVDYILKEAKREVAGPMPESVIEYDRRYTLEKLREIARQAGLSPSGSKKEIAARLIAKGVK